jgi:fatty acid desaturase
VAGRLLIHASLDPVSWSLGVASLATQKVLSTSELGHNILHAQYNFLDDPRFHAQGYQWDFAVDEAQWRREHNTQHHVHTNVVGKDPDLTYTAFRLHDREAWNLAHLVQPLGIAVSWVGFDLAIGAYVSGVLDRYLPPARRLVLGQRAGADARKQHLAFVAKAARLAARDFVLFPVLGGVLAPKILLGNLLANVLRNAFLGTVIYCGHFTDGMTVFMPEDVEGESRGQAAVRQILASGDFEGGPILSLLSGHLNYQIEHHVFPTIPAWRYPEIARRLRPLCEKYGIPYNSGTFGSQFGQVVRRIVRLARPPAGSRAAARRGAPVAA